MEQADFEPGGLRGLMHAFGHEMQNGTDENARDKNPGETAE